MSTQKNNQKNRGSHQITQQHTTARTHLFDVVDARQHANAPIIEDGQLLSQLWVCQGHGSHGDGGPRLGRRFRGISSLFIGAAEERQTH